MTLHIEIDRDTEKRLASFAKKTGQKIETLASKILKQGIDTKEQNERECSEDEKSWQACEKGEYISNDRVMDWLASWGKVDELPCPTIK